ncbi:MAG: dephospho-CoA kinase [Acidobacteria bacterium]|nr:dephospho-CoA kinase [Acidobacteriota bacterium]
MLRVGLTGGLASGKSFVGRTLEGFGCHWIRADDLGHAVIAPDGEACQAVAAEFGTGILAADGAIDRKKLGAIVFADPARLARLNALVHPHVFARQESLLAGIEARDARAIAVVEAAIMIETGSHRRYQKLIVAVCPEWMQIERAIARDGLTRQQVADRLSRQIPLKEKAGMADYVIDTSISPEETVRQTQNVYQALRSLQP